LLSIYRFKERTKPKPKKLENKQLTPQPAALERKSCDGLPRELSSTTGRASKKRTRKRNGQKIALKKNTVTGVENPFKYQVCEGHQ